MREVYITMGLPCCGKTKYCYDHADSITNVYTSNSCYNANWNETFYIDSDVQTNDELNKVFLNLLDRNNIKINIIYFKENKQQSIQNLKYKYFSGSNESIRKEKDRIKYIIKNKKLEYPDKKQLLFDFKVIEVETFICPNYYKEMSNEIKQHLKGNFLCSDHWITNSYEITSEFDDEFNSAFDDEEEPDFSLFENFINDIFINVNENDIKELQKFKKYEEKTFSDYYLISDYHFYYINIFDMIDFLKKKGYCLKYSF